jgi:hypothetical protein
MVKSITNRAIRNFFVIRRWYNYVRGVSYIALGATTIFFNFITHPKILWIPLLFYLLALCLSVELAKAMFKFPIFKRKKSGKSVWIIFQITINFLASAMLMWAILDLSL